MKVIVIIGIVLTAFVTIPIILFMIILVAVQIYDDWRRRPDAPPPSKDEWRSM